MQKTQARKPFPTHILVFLAPAVIIYTIFMVFPLIDSLRLSFFTITDQEKEIFMKECSRRGFLKTSGRKFS